MSVMGLGHMNIWGLYWKLWTNFFLLGFTIHVQGMFLYLEHIFVWIKQGSVTCCKLWENEVRKTLLHFCVQIGRENLLIKLDIFIVSTGCCASSDKDDGDKVIPKFKPKQTQVKQSSKGIQRKRPLSVKPQGLDQVIFLWNF